MAKQKFNVNGTAGSDTDIDPSEVPFFTSSRVGLALLGFFGFVNVYALRVNMSVAIVCMVNHTALLAVEGNSTDNTTQAHASPCSLVPVDVTVFGSNETDIANGTSSKFQDGEFVWNKSIQGIILGSFFWGYLLTQIPGGWLATKIGGKRVFGYSMFLATVATFLTPIGARTSYIFLIVLRIIVGIASGVCYPCMHAIWGGWAPPLERSKLVAFTYAGAQVGNVITMPLAGLLCKYGFDGGWPSIFYVLGIMSLVWFVLWMWLVSDSPAQHPRISQIEKDYILNSLKTAKKADHDKPLDVPWKSIVTSVPVITILVANITTDWGTYTLLTSIPTYMNEVLQLDISSNGFFSALPFIAFWVMINIAGFLADLILTKGCCSITLVRKCFTFCGTIIPGVLLVALGYIDCTQPGVAIGILVMGVAMTGNQYAGWIVNSMDVAPAFAGIIFGICNSIAAVTGFLSPVIVGVITKNKSREEWQVVFYITAGIYAAGAIFYAIFASGEVQPWAHDDEIDAAEHDLLEGTEMRVGPGSGKAPNGDAEKALMS